MNGWQQMTVLLALIAAWAAVTLTRLHHAAAARRANAAKAQAAKDPS